MELTSMFVIILYITTQHDYCELKDIPVCKHTTRKGIQFIKRSSNKKTIFHDRLYHKFRKHVLNQGTLS